MVKALAKLIFIPINFLDNILNYLFNRSFIIWFSEFINYEKYSFGFKFFIPNPTIRWRVNTLYQKEPETIEWIKNFQNNSIFWDIGANIGLFSLYCAKTHPNISVISFEPSTSNLRVLSRNIYLNNFQDKIKIFQLPLSNKSFEFSSMNEGVFTEGGASNSFGVNYDYSGNEIQTKNEYQLIGTSIDFIINNKFLKIPNYIKIDVDGIEHLILTGAIETLKSNQIREILIEINENFGDQYSNCLKILSDSGFKLREKFKQIAPKNSKDSDMYNYIFTKEYKFEK